MRENKIINFDHEREKRLDKVQQSVSYTVQLFLELNNISHADIVWGEDSSPSRLNFDVQDPDTGDTLLTGDWFHKELINYLVDKHLPELRDYTINPDTGQRSIIIRRNS